MKNIFLLAISMLSMLISCEVKNGTEDFVALSKDELNVVSNSVSIVDDNLLYASWDTSVCLYSLKDKKKLIEIPLNDLCFAKPILKDSKLYLPFSDSTFSVFDIGRRKKDWSFNIPGRCTNFEFLSDSILILSVNHFGLLAINSSSGKKLYDLRYNYNTCFEPDLSPWSITKDSDTFYVTNWECKTLTAVRSNSGEILWSIDVEGYGGNPVAISDNIFCGVDIKYTDGSILIVDKKTGKTVKSEKCRYETHANAVAIDEGVICYGYDGVFYIYDSNKKQLIPLKSEKINLTSGPFIVDRFAYFSNNKFEIQRLNLDLKKIETIGTSKYQLQYAFGWNDDIYLIK